MKPEICGVCRQRLDAVLWAVGRHPNCGSSPPITDASETRVVAALARCLGAVPIEIPIETKEIRLAGEGTP